MFRSEPLSLEVLTGIFRTSPKDPKRIINREGTTIEFKESYNHGGMAQYFRAIAAFANNSGGYILFGVGDKPRRLLGLGEKSLKQFEELKVEEFTKNLLDYFSPEIKWDHCTFEFREKSFGVIYVYPLGRKPCICKKHYDDSNPKYSLKEGDIYYRYGGRSERIRYEELSAIIDESRKNEERQWLSFAKKAVRIGVSNAALLDLNTGNLSGTGGSVFLDAELLKKIAFIQEGRFVETGGTPTLRIIGDVTDISIKYMTDEALATLKANTDGVTGKLIENPNNSAWLKTFFPGTLWVTKKYEIEEFALKVPKDDKDRETDIYNSILLYDRLHHLPLYVLTDERFWCWVNFEIGYEVALKYMPVKKGSSVFKDHWLLTQGKRRGLFFGVLSRCYFRVALSVDETLDDPYELTRFVIENPLRFRELTWRSFSSEKMIVLGTLKAEKRVMTEYPQTEENTKHFAEIAKLLSKLGSVMLLDCMTEKDIEEYVYKKYKAMVEEELANRGPLRKLKDAVVAALHG